MNLTMRKVLITLMAILALGLAACAGEEGYYDEASKGLGVREEQATDSSAAGIPMPAVPPTYSGGMTSPGTAPIPAPEAPAPPRVAAPGGEGQGVTGFSEENVAQLVTLERIIVRTVDINLIVSDISGSLDSVSEMAREMGGWVVSSRRLEKHQGSISIRVPAAQLDQAVSRLREMAVDVESEVTTSKDVTDEYVDTTARLGNLQATEGALLKLLERAESVEDALKVQESLTRTQGEIEQLKGRIKYLEETAAYSLVNVTLELEPAEMPVDAGADQTSGVGEDVRFRAYFKPPEGIDEYTFEWDFGDGSGIVTSNRTAPTGEEDTRVTATMTHSYRDEKDSPFIARIEMKGTGESGIAEGEDILIVSVTKIPSVEVFAGEGVVVEEGEEVEFQGSFTRPAGLSEVEYHWDFGDGTPAATGKLDEGVSNAVATHVYEHFRPFPYTATLTITAESDAGEVENTSSVSVRVTEAAGWVVGGWSVSDIGKTAVRTLSAVGQGIGTLLIWLGIFSPIWIIGGLAGVMGFRRYRRRK